jgi:CheY-like chemotaxis protein
MGKSGCGMELTKPESQPGEAGRQPPVLVVDDEPGVGAVVMAVLRRLGFRGVVVADPREALRMIEQEGLVPRLLITDHSMPHMSGLELLSRCKTALPHLKSILCTGQVSEAELEAAVVRPDVVLEKPFETQALGQIIRSLLSQGEADPAS